MTGEAWFLDVVSGRKRGALAASTRALLNLATPAYRLAIAARNLAFDGRWRTIQAVSAPVISIGNLTTGGVGKTPVVAALVTELTARGVRAGIASRGYRSLDASGNDERRVLDRLCPGAPHRQNRDRVAAARELIELDGCGAVVLDDGFQHRRLHRDIDVVLIDATNPWGYGRLLPRGLLREPRGSLARADLVMITRGDQVSAEALDRLRGEVGGDAIVTRFAPRGLISAADVNERVMLESLRSRRLAAFCGIGNPEGFRRTLELAGLRIDEGGLLAFPDHCPFDGEAVERIQRHARERGAEALVCTLKDLVKLPRWPDGPACFAVDIGLEFLSGRSQWDALVEETERRAGP
ncbi:MAG: tetraacyldisaccharide 4'-kinase [Planctomyces sp.]|nr:tetraacyldisaccharide 4'-kinase [Planctomyces sp.]